jgi:hypothetical protein
MTNTQKHSIMVLPTIGRVIIDTTVGEIDIELWSKVGYKNIKNAMTLKKNYNRKHQKHVATSSHWQWRVCEFLSNLLVYFIKKRDFF